MKKRAVFKCQTNKKQKVIEPTQIDLLTQSDDDEILTQSVDLIVKESKVFERKRKRRKYNEMLVESQVFDQFDDENEENENILDMHPVLIVRDVNARKKRRLNAESEVEDDDFEDEQLLNSVSSQMSQSKQTLNEREIIDLT